MNYQEFVGSVTGFLREALPCGTELSLVPLEKNNGVILEGLTVRKEGRRAAPAIYLDPYYQEYLSGRSLRQIQETILDCCEENEFSEHFDADFFSDYRRVRPNVVYKLMQRALFRCQAKYTAAASGGNKVNVSGAFGAFGRAGSFKRRRGSHVYIDKCP